MHELSIANAILEVARRSVPVGCVLKSVRVIAGPMRAIEPQAMQFAWESVIADEKLNDVGLNLALQSWKLHCPVCGNEWTSDELQYVCTCGCTRAFPVGGDELRVDTIEIEDAEKGDHQ